MDYQDNKLKKWLNKLQRESWQLELLISGFAIFLMLGALQALREMKRGLVVAKYGMDEWGELLDIGYVILVGACFFILINLVVHVLLRGLWISTIGLRYVSGDIDYASLRFADKFDRFLQKRIGSFDRYILKLENVCSIVFAFTFLLVFMLVGVGTFFAVMVVFFDLLEGLLESILPEAAAKTIGLTLVIIWLLFGLLYFVDFLTLGFVKRVKWLSKIYYPFYRFFGFITLAGIYRPIYYNLVDNKFGRRVGLLLVPYLVGVVFFLSAEVTSFAWFPDEIGDMGITHHDYDDQRRENTLITSGSLPSRYVSNGFLELFIAYQPKKDDPVLEHLCPTFKPPKERGFGSDIVVVGPGDFPKKREGVRDTSMLCLSQLYEVQVDDSLFAKPAFKFYYHTNFKEPGLFTVLDVDYLPRGEHAVKVSKWNKHRVEKKDTLMMESFFQIPFWKE